MIQDIQVHQVMVIKRGYLYLLPLLFSILFLTFYFNVLISATELAKLFMDTGEGLTNKKIASVMAKPKKTKINLCALAFIIKDSHNANGKYLVGDDRLELPTVSV